MAKSATVPEQDEPQTGWEKQDNAITGGTNPVVGTFEKAYDYLFGGNDSGGFKQAVQQLASHKASVSGDDDPSKVPYAPALPVEKSGLDPEGFVPNTADPNYKKYVGDVGDKAYQESDPSGDINDAQWQTFKREADSGNELAKQILKAYKPEWEPTANQDEQSIVQPFANALKALPGEYTSLEAQQAALTPSLASSTADVDAIAKQYGGVTPNSPDATTQGIANSYLNTASSAIQANTPIMQSALKDMGSAAELSLKTFPYTAMLSDLLNRFAYNLESPSYPTTPEDTSNLPSDLQDLMKAAGITSSYSASSEQQLKDLLANTQKDGTGGGIIPVAPSVAGAS